MWLSILLILGALAGVAEAGPAISISPSPIEFYGGPLFVFAGAPPGEPQQGFYQVQNTGDATLVVTQMAITGANAGIMRFDGTLDPFCGSGQTCAQTFSLAPGQSRTFQLTCTAEQAGYFAASLGVTSNAAAGTSTAPMSCLGLRPPIIQISPTSLDFGIAHWCDWDQSYCDPCPTQPLTQTLTVTNAAAAPSRLDFYITPTLPSSIFDDWDVGDMCSEQTGGCAVTAGQSLPIVITFRPRQSTLHTSPLTLVSLFPGQAPISIPLHAEGGHGMLVFDTPAYLGAAPVGETITRPLTVHNAGRSCWRGYGPYTSDPEIRLVGASPAFVTLASGESRNWTLSCTPSHAGPVGTFLDFDVFWEGISLTSQFASCDGVNALVASPASLAFTGIAEVPLGTSATRRVTLRNASDQATDLAAIAPSDPRFTASLVSGSLPLTLAPGATAEVDVTFTPADTERTSGTIAFDATGVEDFALGVVGDGVRFQAEATPAAFDFGAVAYPEAAEQSFELRNTGNRTLTVTRIALDLPGDFTVTGIASGATIAAGETLGFSVRATPTAPGPRHATLVLELDLGRDVAIPLDAAAKDPGLTFAALAGDAAGADPGAGCGCTTGAPVHGLPLGAALLLARRRRRRAPR